MPEQLHYSTISNPTTKTPAAHLRQEQQQNDYKFKLLLIGDSAVGKTCLLCRYADQSFFLPHVTTIGIDFKVQTVEIDGKQVSLHIWDTAGHERFRAITAPFYRGAAGIMLVYDICDRKSFQNIGYWMRNIEQNASTGVETIIVGNKSDLEKQRVISTEQGRLLAARYKVPFLETSAKSDINVEESFLLLAKAIKVKVDQKTASPIAQSSQSSIKVGQTSEIKQQRSCCD